MKSIKFVATIGINEGYSLADQNAVDMIAFGELYKEVAKDVFESQGQYVSCSATPVKTLYHADWGCPVGGENCVMLTGICNPQFSEISAWRQAVLSVCKELKKQLNQSTVTVEFMESEIEYLN